MRNSPVAYRRWCQHVRACGLKTHRGRWSFARQQWNLYWDGIRDGRLHDCCIWLISEFGF